MNFKSPLLFINVVALLGFLWITGFFGIWIHGIKAVSEDAGDIFTQAYPVEGNYTVKISLSNLEKNEGKVLYEEENNKIYVSEVFIDTNSNYQVVFRSSGNYNFSGATLVSGIEHARQNNGYTDILQAKATAAYQGRTFELFPAGSAPLKYKDGDEFSFYLYASDVDPENEEAVEITLSNLYINFWARKPNL
ncbi:hypothetical protein [Cytobacillus sp. BC1816]|uniref:hypothetical protein n=1 Tax=Cytobacillus sp. BC1816 TaxID=3440154 RepID=UPI003F515798